MRALKLALIAAALSLAGTSRVEAKKDCMGCFAECWDCEYYCQSQCTLFPLYCDYEPSCPYNLTYMCECGN